MNSKENIFRPDRLFENDSRFLEKDYCIGGGVTMKRTDIDFGFFNRKSEEPKESPRSDERIYEEICELLTAHGHIDASDIIVTVKDGIVTLEGLVNSRGEKLIADEITEEVSGVQNVLNNIHLRNRLIKSG
jgi:osmotically-inducible protein OsmY